MRKPRPLKAQVITAKPAIKLPQITSLIVGIAGLIGSATPLVIHFTSPKYKAEQAIKDLRSKISADVDGGRLAHSIEANRVHRDKDGNNIYFNREGKITQLVDAKNRKFILTNGKLEETK